MAEKIIKREERVGASEKRREKSKERLPRGGKYNHYQHVPLHLNAEHKTICKVYNSNFSERRKWREDEGVRRGDCEINMHGHSDRGRGSRATYFLMVS